MLHLLERFKNNILMKIIQLKIGLRLMQEMDSIIKECRYKNRSGFISDAVNELIIKMKSDMK